MTTCVALLCGNSEAIVLAADKMIGLGYVESEPDVSKIYDVHRNWRVMIAGNGIEPIFDMIEAVRTKLSPIPSPTTQAVISEVTGAYQEKRLNDAEARYLKPIGWSLDQFRREGVQLLGEFEAARIRNAIGQYEYELQLLVAGFDETGKGRIFSVTSRNKGAAQRHDLGFHAIGSGATNARFIMTYRKVGSSMTAREAVYYALEGKYYGELASGVGLRTDGRA